FSFGVSTFPDFDESDSDADEDIQLDQKTNGKSIVKVEQAKSTAGKPKVPQANAPASKAKPKIEELKKADKQKANKDDDDESEEDESDDDEVCSMAVKYVIFLFDKLFTSSVFQCLFCCLFCLFGLVLIYDMVEAEDDSEDEDEVESSDEDEAPVKKTNNKLTGGAAKKDGHSATPLPAKQIGKTTAKNAKSKQQTPNSAGSVNCKSCGKYVFSSPQFPYSYLSQFMNQTNNFFFFRNFNSDNALQAHTKAKHSAGK
ncbi:hypothetical protein BHM03_00018999, partial [Ensete ventricosum]